MSLFRVPPLTLPWIAAAVASAFVACSDDETEDLGSTTPPTLEITGYSANAGSELLGYEPQDPVQSPCDGLLSVVVGPNDGAGRLVDWDLRPPGACGRINQCGYVEVHVLDADGGEVARGRAASVRVPVDVGSLATGVPYRVVAELRQGTTGEAFTVLDSESGEQQPVRAEAPLTLTEGSACPDVGGLGGGGAGGLGGGGAGGGGLGGLGGFGGDAG